MASIRKRGNKYQVRWTESDGTETSRSGFPDRRSAERFRREVEAVRAAGRDWQPPKPPAGLEDLMIAWLQAHKPPMWAPATWCSYRTAVSQFWDWLCRGGKEPTVMRGLTRANVQGFFHHLLKIGRSQKTAAMHASTVARCWAWLAEEYDEVPRYKRCRFPQPPPRRSRAPVWEQGDAAILHCHGESRRLAGVVRYTGLRVSQAIGLRWSDFDLDAGRLDFRGELGKTRQEKAGRIIVLAPHFVRLLEAWQRRGTHWVTNRNGAYYERPCRDLPDWLVYPARNRPNMQGPRRLMARAWRATDAPQEVYAQPFHAFRHGFISNLNRDTGDLVGVAYLVGHRVTGMATRSYLDPEVALRLERVVDKVPRCPAWTPDGQPVDHNG